MATRYVFVFQFHDYKNFFFNEIWYALKEKGKFPLFYPNSHEKTWVQRVRYNKIIVSEKQMGVQIMP